MADIHHPAGQPARLSITQTTVDGIRVLAVAGELDADNVGTLRQALRVGEDSAPALTVLDLGAVTFMDSSAVNVLVAANRDATAAGGRLRMAALSEPVRRVVEIVGLDTIIACYPTLAQALRV
ncbi:STAS domain-containing protein [Streptomyces triticiradicis]|uniref:Anti-sigma factor antagonist n=1 Tax=Streptomyces triticiradicis TaxID=2651189 RepID=A0A7J5D4E0_9ACTN|nr:STAS domain-containing protein [Streptomyces triticiradicis]KAB1978871.1 STAS domain-containing protein [Streptomyces triticiradicis]